MASSTLQHARHGLGLGSDRWPEPVTDDLAYVGTGIVNLYLFGREDAGDRGRVLIDAGLIGPASVIARAAEVRFGAGARPSAIVLTHGHFDHVEALEELADRRDVPVYAHPMDLPYLNGRSSDPPPDPTVGGGMMAALSWLYPRSPMDVGDRARPLPEDGSVPGMDGWRWIHTPGHTPGHASLFRESDRTLIVGDAFITTKQESALAVATQASEIHGPPCNSPPTGPRPGGRSARWPRSGPSWPPPATGCRCGASRCDPASTTSPDASAS